jgi:NAD(P)-dependent dehydrogenase (short-subunit alcohol dehydrogenase family)
MPSILISGSSRGLGLELARQYAADGWRVYATCRNPEHADRLHKLGSSNISLHRLDVADEASIRDIAGELAGVPLDIVFANAGINEPRAVTPETVTRSDWLDVMTVNTFAPLALIGALKANLLAGEQKKAVAMSSLMGSIGSNNWGTQYVYRASKSALNALWRNLSIEWKDDGIICVVMRPGFVKTEMTNFTGDLLPEETVSGMRAVLARVTMAESGCYHSYDGKILPW